MIFGIRMYFLDEDKVPKRNYLGRKDMCCLAILLNIAYENRNNFEFYGRAAMNTQLDFQATFERQGGFYTTNDINARICTGSGKIGVLFFRLLHATWQKIHCDHACNFAADNTRIENDLLIHSVENNEYATNNWYLPTEENMVKNSDIIKFATDCMKKSVFVASAFGFKNRHYKLRGYLDVTDKNETNLYLRKATDMLSSDLKNILDLDELYPEYITRADQFFRHDLCPVIYGVDVGHDMVRLGLDEAIVPNGFACKRYVKEMLAVTKNEMKNSIQNFRYTGKSCLMHFCYVSSFTYVNDF